MHRRKCYNANLRLSRSGEKKAFADFLQNTSRFMLVLSIHTRKQKYGKISDDGRMTAFSLRFSAERQMKRR